MIKAIMIDNEIIILENIHKAKVYECGSRFGNFLKIEHKGGEEERFDYPNIEDAKRDLTRLLYALNGMKWEGQVCSNGNKE